MFGFNVNFGGMGEQMEVFNCVFDIESGGAHQRQSMKAPRIMIEQQFMQLVQQAAQDSNPVKIKLSRMAECSSWWDDKTIKREVYIVFTNNAYGEYKEEM